MIENRLALEIVTAAMVTVLLAVFLRRWPSFSARVVSRVRRSMRHRAAYIVAIMLVPVLGRLALVPWLPPPTPAVADEFSHLLVADTLRSGRLANPPHPLAGHLETVYVLQEPTYSSIYPIGQGLILAVGEALTGHPWTGVLLAVSLMSGAITWMLLGYLPVGWALVGGALAAWQYGFSTGWSTGYWGGAFCAFGGALLFGALCRLWKAPAALHGLVAGAGWTIVWLIRPFESVLLLLVAWSVMAALAVRAAGQRGWVAPAVLMLSLQVTGVAVVVLHNKAVTGSFAVPPYRLSQIVSGVPQSFVWQDPIEPPSFRFPEAAGVYRWQRETRNTVTEDPLEHYAAVVRETWRFFITPWFTVPVILLIWRRERIALQLGAMVLIALAANATYPFFGAHYVAAYAAVFALLIAAGLRALARYSIRGYRVGRLAAVFLLVIGILDGLRSVPVTEVLGIREAPVNGRAEIARSLAESGGRHVVFVKYGPTHVFHHEWVYNEANVDEAPVVWVRALGPVADVRVARYYRDRRLWLAEVEGNEVRSSPYDPEAH